jgi:hypothetical protein
MLDNDDLEQRFCDCDDHYEGSGRGLLFTVAALLIAAGVLAWRVIF